MQFPFHYFLPPGGWLGPVSRHPFVRMYGMCRKGQGAVHKPAHIPGLHIREKFRGVPTDFCDSPGKSDGNCEIDTKQAEMNSKGLLHLAIE